MALSNELVTCHLDISGDLSIYTLHKNMVFEKVNNNTAVLAKNRKIDFELKKKMNCLYSPIKYFLFLSVFSQVNKYMYTVQHSHVCQLP